MTLRVVTARSSALRLIRWQTLCTVTVVLLGCRSSQSTIGLDSNGNDANNFIVRDIFPASSDVFGAALSPDGTRAAIFQVRGGISFVDTRSARVLGRVNPGFPQAWHYAADGKFCDNGKYLITRVADNVIAIDTDAYRARTLLELKPSTPSYVDCASKTGVGLIHLPAGVDGAGAEYSLVYNLESGEPPQRVEAESTADELERVIVSPSGTRMAFLMYRKPIYEQGRGFSNVKSRDGDNYLTLISLKDHSILHTDLLEPETNQGVRTYVSFAGDDAVATLAPYIDLADRSQPLHISIWDASSGHQIQTIADRNAPPESALSTSADGRVVFSFTGKTDYSGQFWWPTREPRFTLWDRGTGRRIAVSPVLQMTHVTCGWISLGSCTAHDEIPELRMDEGGNAVIAFTAPTIGHVHEMPVRVFTLK